MSTKEQNRLQILNGVLERYWSMPEAAPLLGVSERQGWRLLAAYRREGVRGLVHKNRGRVPPNVTPEPIQQQVVTLARERYWDINHRSHLATLSHSGPTQLRPSPGGGAGTVGWSLVGTP